VNTENDRLFEFLLEDSIDSLNESQPPDEDALLADSIASNHKGAATFRSLTKKDSAHTLKPLKLNPAGGPAPGIAPPPPSAEGVD
jgi:hypothetical protein